jgi:hypothetical protein
MTKTAEQLYEEARELEKRANELRHEAGALAVKEACIKHMAERFLGWKLPDDFNPDGGIDFERFGNAETPHQYERQPVGTNLLNYEQAVAMVRYMIEGLPE